MANIRALLGQAVDGLLLRDDAYRAMRDAPNPVRRGLTLIIVIGVIVALAGIIGVILFRLTAPDFSAIQEVVWEGMLDMPWIQEIPEEDVDEIAEAMRQGYDMGWQIARFFIPNIPGALANVILKPLGMVIVWLIYGVLAFAAARILGGRGGLGVTYGVTALAAAPQLLGVVNVMPYVQTAGLGAWALVCNYLALKHAHGLSAGRTFWATLIPYAVIVIGIFALAAGGFAVFTLFAQDIAGGLS